MAEPISTGAMLGMAGISGLSSLAGGLLGNASAKREAARNRNFQLMMSSTAHQREVKDLRAAGLNPILSATGGPGASTGSGSTAQQDDVITPAVSSAISLIRTMAEATKLQAEALTEANRPQYVAEETERATSAAQLNRDMSQTEISKQEQIEADIALKQIETVRSAAQTALANSQKLSEDTKRKILGQDYLVAVAEAKRAKTEGEIDDTTFGKVMRYLDRLKNAVSPWSPNSRPGKK